MDYLVEYEPKPMIRDPLAETIIQLLEWATRNPEKVIAFGVGIFVIGLLLKR